MESHTPRGSTGAEPILLDLLFPLVSQHRMPNRAFEETVLSSRFNDYSTDVDTLLEVLGDTFYSVSPRGTPVPVNAFGATRTVANIDGSMNGNTWTTGTIPTSGGSGAWPEDTGFIPISEIFSALASDQVFVPLNGFQASPDTVITPVDEERLLEKVNMVAYTGCILRSEVMGLSTNNIMIKGRQSRLTVRDPGDLTRWDHPDYAELAVEPFEYAPPEPSYQSPTYHLSGPAILSQTLDTPLLSDSSGHVVYAYRGDLADTGRKFNFQSSSVAHATSVWMGAAGHLWSYNQYGASVALTFTEKDSVSQPETKETRSVGYNVRFIYRNYYSSSSSQYREAIYEVASAGNVIRFDLPREQMYRMPDCILVAGFRFGPESASSGDIWQPTGISCLVQVQRRANEFMKAPRLPLSFTKYENLQAGTNIVRMYPIGYEGITSAIKRDVDKGEFPPCSPIPNEARVLAVCKLWSAGIGIGYTMSSHQYNNAYEAIKPHTTHALMKRFEAGFWTDLGKGILKVGRHVAGPLAAALPWTRPFATQIHQGANAVADAFGAAPYRPADIRRDVDGMYDHAEDLREPQSFEAGTYRPQSITYRR